MSKVLLADWVFLRAARDVAVGEELTQYYCDVRMPVEMRQKELFELFEFKCNCSRCAFELELEGGPASGALKPWKKLYSCEVPGFHPKMGPIQASQLEGLVSEAEEAAQSVLKSRSSSSLGLEAHVEEQWLLWPLVPALQQLALRLRLDGRLRESAEARRKAEKAACSVVPLSNLHLRIQAELLLTEARRPDSATHKAMVSKSLACCRAAYGGGFHVWQSLFGFRMPKASSDLAMQLESQVLEEMLCVISFQWQQVEKPTGPGCACVATLQVSCSAFRSIDTIRLEASPAELLVAAPGATDARISCPFRIDIDTLQTTFSKRRRRLTILARGC
eukprot:TRINITY_DN73161_c0_g1_i1.p1 TRINITY_DN73161_c0_g1~~TRINITY_DN73161_c0_g1_i1.p1  ORF type:complete len:377 (-),score=61.26 TRINITY_DN73161_c0_g1_i1:84-1082(-)